MKKTIHISIYSILIIGTFFIYSFLSSKNTPPVIKPNWANEQLAKMTLDEKIAQFFMIAAYPGNGEQHMKEIETTIRETKIGGVIWFPKTKENYIKYAGNLQKSSENIPLFYALDAEWGASMRMNDVDRFPYAYSIGAANDLKLSEKLAQMMAYECADLGIQFNFSPVADVNSNPNNPVIGFRSFGEDSDQVAHQVAAFVKGFESVGVYSSIKHFPGHGDTDKDSHFDLPVINKSAEELLDCDWIPFKAGIKAGATSVMVGHLNVPQLDPSGTPSSLSKIVIQDYLKGKLGFKGIVISDALNMKAVANKYGKTEVAVKAFEAGCDILVYSENVKEAIQAIKAKVKSGQITEKEINERCLKLLLLKEKSFIKPVKGSAYTKGEEDLARYETFEKSTVLLKNENKNLPFTDLSKKILHVSIGSYPSEFIKITDEIADLQHINLSFEELEKGAYNLNAEKYKEIIVTVHATTVLPKDQFGMPKRLPDFLSKINSSTQNTIVFFGNPLILNNQYNLSAFQSVILAYENNAFVQNRVAQQLFGAIAFKGKLATTINKYYLAGDGLTTVANGRMKFSQPEELGIDPKKLDEIDQLINSAIAQHSFPGCQIVAALNGKIFYQKSFGSFQYNDEKVTNDDLYDIASITKIAASTTALMKLQSDGKINLDKTLADYIPNRVKDSPLASLKLRELLAHQAGLKPFIPFYNDIYMNGVYDSSWLSNSKVNDEYVAVANNLFIKKDYLNVIKEQIIKKPLGTKKYLYSDLGYYFIKEIIEQESGKSLDQFLNDEVYSKLGMSHTLYNPLQRFDRSKITPTENDKLFRQQIIRGYVHDPGAAMIGGVGGHAGLFSNATELIRLMHLFLNKGNYGGVQILDPKVIAEYTRVQFPGNRRGAGFDKPVLKTGGGTCDESASFESFGHSGFTGTLAWADPKNGLTYVFLSNRVYPDANNKKLISMGTRSQVQRILNEAIKERKRVIHE